MSTPPKDNWVLKASYRYANETGQVAFEKQRLERGTGNEREKRFRIRHYVKGQGWVWSAPAQIYPYRLDEVIKADAGVIIWIVEGEKCVEAIRERGGVATSGAYGANPGTFLKDWVKYFRGRRVVLLPDLDDNGKGQAFMRDVYELLKPVAESCTYLELQGLSNKGDVFDWFALGHDYDELKELAFMAMADPAPPAPTVPAGTASSGGQVEASLDADGGEDLHAWKPFPLDALPVAIGEYCHAGSDVMKCDPTYFALPGLTAASGAIGNKRVLRLNPEWPEPAVIWCILVAESGTMKSPAYDSAMEPINAIESELWEKHDQAMQFFEEQLAAWESSLGKKGEEVDSAFRSKPKAPAPKRLMAGDITIEKLIDMYSDNPRGLLLVRDEVAGWFGSFARYRDGKGATDVPFWLEAFNARKWVKDRKGGEKTTTIIPHCGVPVFGNTQPDTARSYFTKELITSGFIARMLFAAPPKRKKVFTRVGIDPTIKQRYHDVIRKLYHGDVSIDSNNRLTRLEVFPSEEGMVAWEEFMAHWAEIQWVADGELAAALAKLEAYCARFALIFACVDHADGLIENLAVERCHVERAFRLVEWFAHEAERIYCTASDDHVGDVTNLTVKYLTRVKKPVTPRELLQSCPSRYRKVANAKAVLEELVRLQKGKWIKRPVGPGGGRPTEEFHLHGGVSDAAKTGH